MRYIVLILFCLLSLAACKTTKKESFIDTSKVSNTDSKISKYESLYYALRDSVRNVPAPKEKSESRGLQRSFLKTSLARSLAYIDSTGLLYHNIENSDSIIQPIRIIEDTRYKHDTVYVNKTDSVYVNKYVYVQEEPSFWEKIRRTVGDIAIGLLIVALLFIAIKYFIKK